MTASPPAPRPSPLTGGWILVTVILIACVAGTWMTAVNYRAQVPSSDDGIVLENQWPESRISLPLPSGAARSIRPGMMAKVTRVGDPHLLEGAVVSVDRTKDPVLVAVRLLPSRGGAGETHPKEISDSKGVLLPPGTRCTVTIDTTVPPIANPEG